MGDSGIRSKRSLDLSGLEDFPDLHEQQEDTFGTLQDYFDRQFDLTLKAVGLAANSDWLTVFPEERRGALTHPSIDALTQNRVVEKKRYTWCSVSDHLGFMGALVVDEDPAESLIDELRDLGPFILSYFRRIHQFQSASVREVVEVPSHPFFTSESLENKRGMQQIFQSSVDSIARIFECDNCRLFWRESPETLRLRAESNSTVDLNTELNISDDPVIERVIRDSKSVLINDLPESDQSLDYSPNVRSFLSVPVNVDGQVMGTVNLSSNTPDVYTRKDLEQFSAICDHLSTVYTATEELFDLTRYVEKVLDELPVGVLTYQMRSDKLQLNPEARNIFRMDCEEIKRKEFETKLKSRYLDTEILEIFDLDRDPDQIAPKKYELIEEDEELPRIVQAMQSSLRDSEEILTGKLIVLSDITQQTRLNEQVNRTERLAALGELASSLAHEIKNPLTSIHGFVQMLPERSDDEEYIEKTARILDKECQRLDGLIDNLHSFAKPQLGHRKTFSLREVIDQTLTLIRKEIEKEDVDLALTCSEDLTLYGDPSKIKQIIMNLSLNAVEAMPSGGELTIGCQPHGSDYGEIYVRDTGEGMTAEEQDKIFNPFYTTKEDGTGLGMAITHRIVEEHGGYINIDSTPGEGTNVSVLIPRHEQAQEVPQDG
ncbi:MAG: ATP-binding protein [bacterium]